MTKGMRSCLLCKGSTLGWNGLRTSDGCVFQRTLSVTRGDLETPASLGMLDTETDQLLLLLGFRTQILGWAPTH